MLNSIFKPFIENSPISIIARATIERALNPDLLDKWFNITAKDQYTDTLLFSTVFGLMSQVVCGSQRSVNAAYQAAKDEIPVSITSLYNKLNGIETDVSATLVRNASAQLAPVVEQLGGVQPSPLPGYRLKLVDGNCIEKSEHRIDELRTLAAAPLPGKSIVVYDPVLRLPVDVFPCEDGHAQERSLLPELVQTIQAGDCWVADRNFCVVEFTSEIALRHGYFVIREHQKYPWKPLGKEKYVGNSDTGKIYEQSILVLDKKGNEHTFRRIIVRLKKPTRDGDTQIAIITNLPQCDAGAEKIAEIYRDRWNIETAFLHLSQHLNSEINTLGYPRAALFGFCVALVAYMIHSVIKSALGAVHGVDTIENKVSGYYIAGEISVTYHGMMIAIPPERWEVFRRMTASKFAQTLLDLAKKAKLFKYKKHNRGAKKPQPKRIYDKNTPHVSTAKILAERKR